MKNEIVWKKTQCVEYFSEGEFLFSLHSQSATQDGTIVDDIYFLTSTSIACQGNHQLWCYIVQPSRKGSAWRNILRRRRGVVWLKLAPSEFISTQCVRDEFSLERRRKTNLKFIKLQRWIGFLKQKYSYYLTGFFFAASN